MRIFSVHSPILLFFVAATLGLSTLGILQLVLSRAGLDIVLGILVLILGVAVLTGGIIAQASLSQQKRMIRLQNDFVSKVSHELRTPLSSIRMFVDTLQGGGITDPTEQARFLGVIASETSRLTRMIERLLLWGRMESGRHVYRMRPEDVRALVGEALAQVEAHLDNSGVHLELALPESPLAVQADREAMVEALRNLLSNALQYGSSGGWLRVAARIQAGRALIEVEDRGPGIPRQEHRRVFERFYRGKAQEEAQTKGSGLGLAMVSLVVKAHRGRVHLRSAPGEGACFTVELPIIRNVASALHVPAG